MARLLFIAPFLAVAAPAQVPREASLSGVVLDPGGKPLRGVRVDFGGRQFITEMDGEFLFTGVSAGNHTLGYRVGNRDFTKELRLNEGGLAFSQIEVPRLEGTSTPSPQPLRGLEGWGEGRQITKGVIAAFASPSREGGHLLVELLDGRSKGFDIWIVDDKGRKIKPVAATSEDEGNPHWSPDGS
ncbi:MAG: hypothetical protein AAB425_00825, partial [Bdellovibrionota bacterium]